MTERKNLWRTVFICYGAVMLFLLFDRQGPEQALPYGEQLRQQLNLVPGRTLALFWRLLSHPRVEFVRTAVINLAGNVIMFIPLGALLPTVFPALRRWWKTVAVAGLAVIAVEAAQLLTLLGSCDIDDLLLNLPGTAIGYGLFCVISKYQKRGADT